MKRAKKERIQHRIANCEDMQIVFRKLMALPLLPPDDIRAAFEWIVTNTPLDIAMHFAPLFEYMNSYWLDNVGPRVLSVFGMECKTNNAIEAYHRVLRVRFGVHPTVWQFTESLCRLQIVVRSSNASLAAGSAITRPSNERHVIQQQILRRAWDLFRQELLDIPRFLACASTFLRAFNHRRVMIEANDVSHFLVVNEVNENRGQILLEEDLTAIRILRRQLPNGGGDIYQESHYYPVCCVPANPWTQSAFHVATGLLAADVLRIYGCWLSENADVRCSMCGLVLQGLHEITIVQQQRFNSILDYFKQLQGDLLRMWSEPFISHLQSKHMEV